MGYNYNDDNERVLGPILQLIISMGTPKNSVKIIDSLGMRCYINVRQAWTRETTRNLWRITGLLAEIWTQDISNT
jgi:hypothetical protein